MAAGPKEHCLVSQGRSECTHSSCWSCWREHHPSGPYDEGYTHHVSQTIDLTKVLVAPIGEGFTALFVTLIFLRSRQCFIKINIIALKFLDNGLII